MTLINPFVSFPAGSAFSPDDIASLSAWFDASDAASFTFSSGTLVSQWDDLSANAYHLTQSDTGKQPTRNATVNSLDAVDFGGSSFLRRYSSPIGNSSGGAWTVFAVASPDVVSTGARNVIDQDQGGGTRIGQLIRVDAATPQTIGFVSGTPVTDSAATISAGGPYLFRSLNGGTTNIEVFVDATGNGATALGGTQNYSASDSPLTMGGVGAISPSNTADQRWDGRICEVICYAGALGSTDINSVETYLADKWGITL